MIDEVLRADGSLLVITLAIAGLRHPHIETIIDEARLSADVELVALAEPDEAIRAGAAERLGVPVFASHREMLERMTADVVGIGAINADRGGIAVDALDAGAHVLADKPLCTTAADLDRIERAHAESGRLLSVAFEKRFYPPTLAVRRLLADGVLGRVVSIAATAPHKLTLPRRPAWMFDRLAYGGILNDLAIHDIDLFLHLTGCRSGRVRAVAGNAAHPDLPEFQDHGVAFVLPDDGPPATFEVHWFSPEAADYHGDYRMRLTGTKGTAELLWKDDVLTVATHDRPPWQESLPARGRPAADFFDALRGRREPQITAADSIAATRLALIAQDAAERGVETEWTV